MFDPITFWFQIMTIYAIFAAGTYFLLKTVAFLCDCAGRLLAARKQRAADRRRAERERRKQVRAIAERRVAQEAAEKAYAEAYRLALAQKA